MSWQTISRGTGLLILVGLFVVYVAGLPRDPAVTLGFMTAATGLIGLPAGWSLIGRRGEQEK